MKIVFLIGEKMEMLCKHALTDNWAGLVVGKSKGRVQYSLIPQKGHSSRVIFISLEKVERRFITKVMEVFEAESWETIIVVAKNYFNQDPFYTSHGFYRVSNYGEPMWYYCPETGVDPISILFPQFKNFKDDI